MHETQNYQLSKIPSAYEKQFCFSFPNDLFSVQVSTKFDLKEELFRPAGPLHPAPAGAGSLVGGWPGLHRHLRLDRPGVQRCCIERHPHQSGPREYFIKLY